ncbi:Carbonyl reductase [NADPH] 1 [Cytospora mali]|uniref:Carbonyl reductase [NADPH] 1 n=1 Tax=Cytospora mali TaxID=578113 RepID=A0A194W902_CYTMA|nr:Carbonyl reductase [NADPH] 1 [Valsa mali]
MSRTIILVTGGNGGIGFEVVAQLLKDANKHVLLGSRSAEKGEHAVKELQSRGLPGTVELLQLDMSREDSILAAAKKVEGEHGRVDAVVNNAGVGISSGSLFEQLDATFRTNATGPAFLVDVFEPLLKKSTAATPRIVNVTSGAGSITIRLDPTHPTHGQKVVAYRASKAALNMISVCQAVEYGPLGWKVFCYNPGFTASNLSEQNKEEKGAQPTSEGARPIVDMLNGKRDEDHGKFCGVGRGTIPW